jgi:hypothetical protein
MKFISKVNFSPMLLRDGRSCLGCLRKWLLEFRESRNFIRKWPYFREISSYFVYFRITFYTTFCIIWHDFHTKFCIPSNKNLTNNKCLGLYWVLKLYKNKRNWNLNPDPKSIFSKSIRNKKNIRNIRNFEYTKCRKHPSEGVGVEGCIVVPPPPPISILKFLCCV